MKKLISVFYRYRPIRKFHISGFIGIGRYEKKLIGRTLYEKASSWMLYFKKEEEGIDLFSHLVAPK